MERESACVMMMMITQYSPRLNMAMPSPASDSIDMDLAIMVGISTCHLHGKGGNYNTMEISQYNIYVYGE